MTIIENETSTVETTTVDLLAAVKDVNRATGKTHPLLAYLRVRTVDGFLEVSAYNYETSIVKRLPVSGVVESVYVVGAALAIVLARLDKGLVTVSVEGNKLVLCQGSKRVQLPTLDEPGDYPEVPAIPEGHHLSVSGANLALIAEKMVPFAGKDDMLPALTAVSLTLAGDTLTAMTTDRFRAAIMPVTIVSNTEDELEALVIGMTDVGAVFGSAERVDVHIDRTHIYLSSESSDMTLRLYEGSFPRLSGLFPTDVATSVTFEPLAFLKSIKFASAACARNTALALRTDDTGVTLTGDTDGEATMTDVVPATLTGEGIETGFNPDFLTSAVKVFGKGSVTMGSTTGVKPSVFTSESVPNLRVLLMPRRLLS